MKTFSRLVFGFAILAACAAPALAANNKAVPEEGAIEIMLLRQHSVQKELKLSDDQVDKIHKFAAEQWEKAEKADKETEAEQDKVFTKLTDENEKFIEKHVTKQQRDRLQEIALQVAGLLLVTRHDITAKLNLTADQKDRIAKARTEARQEAEELLYTTKKDEQREKLKEIKETTRKKMDKILTDEQKVTWRRMIGETFSGDLVFYHSDQASK
jgi:Spy/CpxP family protein refolding chaperone